MTFDCMRHKPEALIIIFNQGQHIDKIDIWGKIYEVYVQTTANICTLGST